MKAKPRRAEREVASILSEHFAKAGYSPVERIPVLGRTGPDISLNKFKLIIDVKNRQKVPKCFLVDEPTRCGRLIAFPLHTMIFEKYEESDAQSLLVDYWIDHMEDWRKSNEPYGITAIVIRKPGTKELRGMPFGSSVMIIYFNQLEEYLRRWKQQ